MASKLTYLPDNIEDLLYVMRVEKGKVFHCGYKRDYLARNLTGMEEGFVVCRICSGIMREASLWKSETTCLVCSANPDQLNSVKIIQDSIEKLEIKCPLLRDCIWNGKLSEAKNHLKNCNEFLLQCEKCKDSVTRCEYVKHITDLCILRQVTCDYCYKQGTAKDLGEHFDVCRRYQISCPNNCGERFPRSNLSKHKSECELEKICCPYTEYGCEAEAMLRRDLLAHKKEFYIEHQDMSLIEIQQLRKENKYLKRKQTEMEMEGKIMKQLDGVEWEITNVDELFDYEKIVGPIFYVNNYKLGIYSIQTTDFYGHSSLEFNLKRLEGKFDKNLEKAYITQFRIIKVKQNLTESYSQDGPMDFELCIGQESELFGDIETWITAYRSLFLRFYFEVNSKKPMEKLQFCNTELDDTGHFCFVPDPFEF